MEYQSINPYQSFEKVLKSKCFDYLFERKEMTRMSALIGDFASDFCHVNNSRINSLKPIEEIRAEIDSLSNEEIRLLFYRSSRMENRGRYNEIYSVDYCTYSAFTELMGQFIKDRIPYAYAKNFLHLDCGPSQVYQAVAERVWNGGKIQEDMLAGLPRH